MRPRRRRVEHAVQGGHPAVIGPLRHQVADIDHEGVRRRHHVAPRPVMVAHLQPARIVARMQDGEAAEIGMRARPQLPRRRRHRLWRVELHREAGDVPVDERREIILRQPERAGHRRQQPAGKAFHRAIVLQPRLGKPGNALREAGRHEIGRFLRGHLGRCGGRTDGESLLPIRRRRHAAGQGIGEVGLARASPAMNAAIRDKKLPLFAVRPREERGGNLVHAPDQRGIDAMAGDDQEADIAADRVQPGDEGRAVAAAEGGKIQQRHAPACRSRGHVSAASAP